MSDGLARIVTEARARAGNARVLLVEYLTVLSDASVGAAEWFAPDEVTALRHLQDSLIEAYRVAAAQTGAELVPASTLSAGHSLGTGQPWVSGFQADLRLVAGSFHPNAAGMVAVAKQIASQLGAGATARP